MPTDSIEENGEGVKRRTVLRQGAITVGGLTFGAGTVAADNKPQTYTTNPVGLTRYSPCTDETLEVVQGKQHFTVHTTEDSGGGYHVNVNSYWDPRPVVVGHDTGAEWSGQNSKGFASNVRPPFPQTVSFLSNTALVTDDSTVNLKYQFRFQLTVNANGDVTAFQKHVEIKCVG